ncbi:MAG: hypothetical protein E6Q97_35890 [Desulfurellales bacterium]|nr:MAG: hypothetical protein E6Q97_35890 [Desulfurellales bacterium]
MLEDLARYNSMIDLANTRIRELKSVGKTVSARQIAQGVEITIDDASFRGRNYQARRREIIPY